MEERYQRNRIYITPEEQCKVKETKILLGGVGLGSVIAECALRLGFETITLIDGDKVELSNLNRQNYKTVDIGDYKVEALKRRLEEINPNAKITTVQAFIDHENVEELVKGHDIAINALDFKSDIPFVFDEVCKKFNIPVVHPYNIGWAGLITVVDPNGKQLSDLNKDWHNFEVQFVKHIANYYRYWGGPQLWLENILEQFENEKGELPPPQLSVASWIVGGLTANLLFDIAVGKSFKRYPQFYLSTTKS